MRSDVRVVGRLDQCRRGQLALDREGPVVTFRSAGGVTRLPVMDVSVISEARINQGRQRIGRQAFIPVIKLRDSLISGVENILADEAGEVAGTAYDRDLGEGAAEGGPKCHLIGWRECDPDARPDAGVPTRYQAAHVLASWTKACETQRAGVVVDLRVRAVGSEVRILIIQRDRRP